MANLAIRGHATRGKEVIEILEMLGGKNDNHCCGGFINIIYFINENGHIESSDKMHHLDYFQLSLEEFLEKFPYKVGDKVLYETYGIYSTIKTMKWNSEKEQVFYHLDSKKLFVATVDELKPCKEEPMDRKYNVEEYLNVWKETEKGLEVVVNDRFELKEDDGKFYIVKKQPQYPKTYEECCKVLSLGENSKLYTKGYKASIIQDFQKLLICRDAYWKIAGDWKPNWEDETDIYYTISYDGVNIKCYNNTDVYSKLAFPTEEMRDVFYGNFKKLIEECKELL